MPTPATLYDLMVVLSTEIEEDRRAKILTDAEAQITSGGGAIERNDDWRTRALAYEIRHQREGEYHLIQFTGPTSLIEAVSHDLRINDGVLRFRIIKVVPGTPPPPDAAPPAVAAPAPPVASGRVLVPDRGLRRLGGYLDAPAVSRPPSGCLASQRVSRHPMASHRPSFATKASRPVPARPAIATFPSIFR